MATGDIKNNLRKLVNSLKGVKYEKDVDYESLVNGVSTNYLPIYHFAFMEYSRAIASEISALGIDLMGRSDQRFIEGMYKVLREIFSYKPPVTRDQFFSNGYSERKIIMASEILNMLIKRHKTLTPKPKVRVNVSMNTTSSSSSSNSKQKPRSASAVTPQSTQHDSKKKLSSAKRPCSTVLPQVVSEVREPPPERVPALLSDSSVLNPGIVDVAPDFTVSAPYNPAMYTYQPTTGKERQNSVEIVSLLDESEPIDSAVRPIDVVKTPGRPLVESHRPPPVHPVTSSPVQPQIAPLVMQKLTAVLQENEMLSSKLTDLSKQIEVINQEKENLAARVTLLENKIQLLEHKNSQSHSQPAPVSPRVLETVQTPLYDSQEQKEDKENRNSSLCDSPSVRSVSEQKTEFANVSPVQAVMEPLKPSLCLELNGLPHGAVDEQAERIKNMMKDTQNLLGMNDSLSSQK